MVAFDPALAVGAALSTVTNTVSVLVQPVDELVIAKL
jgi:hypothetical protein